VKNNFVRGAVVFIGIIAVVVVMSMFATNLTPGKGEMKDIEFPEFLSKVQDKSISRVNIMEGESVLVGLNSPTNVTEPDNTTSRSYSPTDTRTR
jgi:ATP-dependent Zn protease